MSEYKGLSAESLAEIKDIANELKQHPAFMEKFDPTLPMNSAVEGLMALKYQCDDVEERAENYKEDGNNNFKFKKYCWARDSYTEGIKLRCKNKELNCLLYANRAACHFRIQNYRTAWKDCVVSLMFKPDHLKSILRGAECCMKMQRYAEVPSWCEKGLQLDPGNEKLILWQNEAEKHQKLKHRDERKAAAMERRANRDEEILLKSIKERGIKLEHGDLRSIENHMMSDAKVCALDDGSLAWPVLFAYPEHKQTDLIREFPETSTFRTQLNEMFGPDSDPPSWDADSATYHNNVANFRLAFEDVTNSTEPTLYEISLDTTLQQALSHNKMIVRGGIPAFIIFVSNTAFASAFLSRYRTLK